jgi:hypothetical protein
MASAKISLSEKVRSALDELVRFDPKAAPGVNVDRKELRTGQAKLIKSLRKRSGPDAAHILRTSLAAAGAHKAAAKIGATEPGADKPSVPKGQAAHTGAMHAAHQATADAHEHGRIADQDKSADAAKVARNSHKSAHDAHLSAAQSLVKAGHYSTSQDHAKLAQDHAAKAMHYHTMAARAGHESGLAAMRAAARKKAVGEATGEFKEWGKVLFNEQHEDPISHAFVLSRTAKDHSTSKPNDHRAGEHLHAQAQKATWHALKHIASQADVPEKHPSYSKMANLNRHHRKMAAKHGDQKSSQVAAESYMSEQRRLMGFNQYPTFKESVTLADLDDFESDIQSWRYRQRDLMGLESHYPMLNEVYDPSAVEVKTTKDPSQGLADTNYQVMADQAERASTDAFKGNSGAHRRAAQAQMAAAKVATNPKAREEHEALAAQHEYHANRSPETEVAQLRSKLGPSGPVIGKPGTVKEAVFAEFAEAFEKMLPEARAPKMPPRLAQTASDLADKARTSASHLDAKDAHEKAAEYHRDLVPKMPDFAGVHKDRARAHDAKAKEHGKLALKLALRGESVTEVSLRAKASSDRASTAKSIRTLRKNAQGGSPFAKFMMKDVVKGMGGKGSRYEDAPLRAKDSSSPSQRSSRPFIAKSIRTLRKNAQGGSPFAKVMMKDVVKGMGGKGSRYEAADTRDIPASVKDQARAIEKDGGPLKKRKGGAKTKAGIAYAIAWKNHCKKDPDSRHCSKGESSPPPIEISKAKRKAFDAIAKYRATPDAAHDTLAKLRKKHGLEHVEEVDEDKELMAAVEAACAKFSSKKSSEVRV